MFELHLGDCLEVMKGMDDNSVDSIVTDPPYGLSFMGKKWDYDVPGEDVWRECLRVLKPGGHLLAFAGTRTQHRMAVRIEDAGFEIRDMIAWVYGSGFPKSHDVSKAIDKAAGAEREVGVPGPYSARRPRQSVVAVSAYSDGVGDASSALITAPATDAAKQWEGGGTALKPALEPITVSRKPLIGTVADSVLQFGTGGINVDGGRVGLDGGRWPANLIHDGSEEVVGLFPGENKGSAARFFYCAKASKGDRDGGLDGFEEKHVGTYAQDEWSRKNMGNTPDAQRQPRRNSHPTVKPTDLMRYLCRLVTPPKGIVLDPFMGSGSTGKAAMFEGFDFVGIERDSEYIEIARARIESARKESSVCTGLFA